MADRQSSKCETRVRKRSILLCKSQENGGSFHTSNFDDLSFYNQLTYTVCWVRSKKNFKYFNRDLHSIVPYGLKVENKHSLKSWIEGKICKSTLSKMTSTKTNKNKKWTPLPKTNFLRYTTLLLGPKRFIHSKGPKIALCLF